MRNLKWSLLISISTLFFSCVEVFSQSTIISGIVVDDQNQPIPFVHVYSMGNFGTICNENGFFRVKLDPSIHQDSVVFSSIGFYEKKVALTGLFSEDTLIIKLSKKDYQLNEVQITPLEETVVLGPDYASGQLPHYFLSTIPFQIGIVIDVPFQAKLKSAHYYIKKTKYSKTPFRVRVYKYDTITSKPSTEVTKRRVLGKLEKRKGWAKINLQDENIFVQKEKIFVAFEVVFMGDDYYHEMKLMGEELQVYGATLTNCIYDRNKIYYKCLIKNYETNEWNEYRFSPNNIDVSFPLIKIELKK